jgi:hypothetical protein
MKRDAFIIPLALLFVVFALVVSVFLSGTASQLFKASKDMDDELFEKYEKLAFISSLNCWEKFLTDNPVWIEHHFEDHDGVNSTVTKTQITIPELNSKDFFYIQIDFPGDQNTDNMVYTITSTSAYYDPEQFTIEFSASPTNENLGVTFTY